LRNARARRDETALARAAGAAGRPGEEALRYLAAYGVAPRRIAKHRREVAILARVLAASGARRILDCPCGWGRLSGALAAEGRRVVLADRSAERLAILRALGLGRIGPALRADARALPFPDGSFDLVLSAHLNYHFDRREDRLRHVDECLRVARGAALVSFHAAFSLRRGIRWVSHLLRGRPPLRVLPGKDLRGAAARRGFALVAVYPLSRFSGHRYALFRRAPT
jgi:2-polyprenyl-3-methyl-5-hydroxy-6-metoxy-1,4-benzoquinol methylase